MKTLYVSDLDGTLLTPECRISPFTANTINSLVKSGMLFSFATARSRNTALKVTKGIDCRLPMIAYNGVFTADYKSGEILLSSFFGGREKEILPALLDAGISPIVYSYDGKKERFTYLPETLSEGAAEFVATRKDDSRKTPAADESELWRGDIFYFTCIDSAEKLRPLYEKFKEKYRCLYQRDIYTGRQWLEIMPKGATKANAALKLKEALGCDKLVAFGDSENDIDLFAQADECYAVSNAVQQLKDMATAVIGSNSGDAVARFLLERFESENNQT